MDAGVFGEGESRISRMLEAVTAGEGPDRIPGTFIKRAGRLLIDDDPVPPWDLGSCPYPYLDQAIGPSREGLLFLETMRGCPFRCRYCHYHKAFPNLRLHPWAQIQAVLDLAYSGNSGVEEIYLMDPSFNARPEFRDLLKSMARRRTSGSPRLHAELRADFLTGEDVALFREAGLSSAEVGLQTVNIEALRLAGRSGDPEETAKGVTLLKGSGIEVTTGIIVGLPGDTPEWFERTLQWLKRTESYSVVHPFVLSILPGTDFRANAAQLGLEYDPRPPYYVTSTRTFPVAALHEALDQCETVFDMELDYIPPPRLVDQGPYVIRTLDGARYVSTWIVDTTRADWSRILPGVIKRATDPFTFWFRGPGGPESEKAVIAVLGEFAQANPHCVVHVVFEFMKAPGPPFLDNAVAVASHPGVYVNRAFSALRMEGEVVCPVFWLLWPDPGDAAVR
ncbi:MAG: radical SAM protein, partial [Deltaproteobacteria bacterium]|nr:radical SAM protein [Deltaproteobacteria bacterium]